MDQGLMPHSELLLYPIPWPVEINGQELLLLQPGIVYIEIFGVLIDSSKFLNVSFTLKLDVIQRKKKLENILYILLDFY